MEAARKYKDYVRGDNYEGIYRMSTNEDNSPIYTGKLMIVVNPRLARDLQVYQVSSTEVELRFADGYPPRRIKLSSITRETVAKAISDIFSMKVVLD
jgi:hypothetical protein